MLGMLVCGDGYFTITASNSASSPKAKWFFKGRQICMWLFENIQAISALGQDLLGVRSSWLKPASESQKLCWGAR